MENELLDHFTSRLISVFQYGSLVTFRGCKKQEGLFRNILAEQNKILASVALGLYQSKSIPKVTHKTKTMAAEEKTPTIIIRKDFSYPKLQDNNRIHLLKSSKSHGFSVHYHRLWVQ